MFEKLSMAFYSAKYYIYILVFFIKNMHFYNFIIFDIIFIISKQTLNY